LTSNQTLAGPLLPGTLLKQEAAAGNQVKAALILYALVGAGWYSHDTRLPDRAVCPSRSASVAEHDPRRTAI
jgi:hypothetical protein